MDNIRSSITGKEFCWKNDLYKHFQQGDHRAQNVRVRMLEEVENNKYLAELELFWIKLLQTIYPMGLNDIIKGVGNTSDVFNTPKRTYLENYGIISKHSQGRRRRNSKIINHNCLKAVSNNTVRLNNAESVCSFLRDLCQQSNRTLKMLYFTILNNSKSIRYEISFLCEMYIIHRNVLKTARNMEANKERYKFHMQFPGLGY